MAAAAIATAAFTDEAILAFSLELFIRSPACSDTHTWGVSSETQMKPPARLSSDTMTLLGMASSSQGTALDKLMPSCPLASRCTAFRALEGSKFQIRSSIPPLRAISCTRASPAAARALECSLATARRSSGSTNARRKRPDCWRPKADSQRPRSFRFAARHFGARAASFRSCLLYWVSPHMRSSMRDNRGQAASSSGTRPLVMQEQRASAAACCGDAAWLDPPWASVWSISTRRASQPELESAESPCSICWPRNSAVNSSGPSTSARASDRSSSKTLSDARNTLGTLS
mmetsp:Transcript_145419/g.405318  ORF Transcript_145419/g.405318 Transcript_145419/m.405318 type:complete len:288 (-) Transcript_145419:923-1786(-)